VAKLIFDKSVEGRASRYLDPPNIEIHGAQKFIPRNYLRSDLPLPSLGELDVIRHYMNLSQKNFCVDTNFYPLGSCTMKYNPKINEDMAALEGFTDIHPYQDSQTVQGALELIYDLEQLLCEITGMERFSFQASAGAHAELTGMFIIRAFHRLNKKIKTKIIVPDSSHGTNPATCSMCGYEVVVTKSNKDGLIDLDAFKKAVTDDTAAVMLTNPNTLGLFEEDIVAISEIAHKKGAFLYYDGANFNPLLGITKPSLMGFDVIHLNFHKTFSTPHGAGGN